MGNCKNYEHQIEDYSGVDFESQFRFGFFIMTYRNKALLFPVRVFLGTFWILSEYFRCDATKGKQQVMKETTSRLFLRSTNENFYWKALANSRKVWILLNARSATKHTRSMTV